MTGPSLINMTFDELKKAMFNLRYTYEFRQLCWRELCKRCAHD